MIETASVKIQKLPRNPKLPRPKSERSPPYRKTLPVTFEAVGQTEGSREVEVRAREGGIVLRRLYTEGSWVKRGTLLFKIDSRQSRGEEAKGEIERIAWSRWDGLAEHNVTGPSHLC